MPEDNTQQQTPQQLVVLNRAPQELVIAKKVSALARLFQVKPKFLELVSKSTQKEGAIPGTFRVTSTNESFKEMRAVILFEPIEQREKYTKGTYNKEAKQCFSLDNVQPHPKAKNPPALYCETCPSGDINWTKWRDAKAKGITGDALAAYLPPCKKFWHLFIASRETKRPYYFNVKGSSVTHFEKAMENVADLMMMMVQDIKAKNRVIEANNAKLPEGAVLQALLPLPQSIADVIYKISFTMYSFQINGGQWMVGMKDFKVMSPEDCAEFGQIIRDIEARREAGQVQTAEAAEAEEIEAELVEAAPSKPTTAQVVAEKNAQIEI